MKQTQRKGGIKKKRESEMCENGTTVPATCASCLVGAAELSPPPPPPPPPSAAAGPGAVASENLTGIPGSPSAAVGRGSAEQQITITTAARRPSNRKREQRDAIPIQLQSSTQINNNTAVVVRHVCVCVSVCQCVWRRLTPAPAIRRKDDDAKQREESCAHSCVRKERVDLSYFRCFIQFAIAQYIVSTKECPSPFEAYSYGIRVHSLTVRVRSALLPLGGKS